MAYIPGDGLHISTLLTVRSCTIMYCTYMYVFSVNKILFKPKEGVHSSPFAAHSEL